MTRTLTVKKKVHFARGERSSRTLKSGALPPAVPKGRVPRVARLMALAIRFDGLIREGVVADQAELARLGRVSRARLTQIDVQNCVVFHLITSSNEQLRDARLFINTPDGLAHERTDGQDLDLVAGGRFRS